MFVLGMNTEWIMVYNKVKPHTTFNSLCPEAVMESRPHHPRPRPCHSRPRPPLPRPLKSETETETQYFSVQICFHTKNIIFSLGILESIPPTECFFHASIFIFFLTETETFERRDLWKTRPRPRDQVSRPPSLSWSIAISSDFQHKIDVGVIKTVIQMLKWFKYSNTHQHVTFAVVRCFQPANKACWQLCYLMFFNRQHFMISEN